MTDRRALAVAVAAFVALAGCAGGALPGASSTTAAPSTSDTTAGTTAGTTAAGSATTYTVTVTEVVDGDTVDVQYANGTLDTVRLLGVDTPETYGENAPGEFEGIPDTDAGRA